MRRIGQLVVNVDLEPTGIIRGTVSVSECGKPDVLEVCDMIESRDYDIVRVALEAGVRSALTGLRVDLREALATEGHRI